MWAPGRVYLEGTRTARSRTTTSGKRSSCRGASRSAGVTATISSSIPIGPSESPSGGFGPRLRALLALLTGGYRLGKRPIRQLVADLLGLSISAGMIAKLERQCAAELATPVAELADASPDASVVGIDETSWREAGKERWLWVTVTSFAVVFTIARTRSGKVARALLRTKPGQVVISDRFPGYEWITDGRQLRWSHLRRISRR